MIRIVLISAAFFSITIALLVIQPGPDPRAAVSPAGSDDVTRIETDLSGLQEIVPPATELSEAEAAEIDDDALGFGLSDSINAISEPAAPSPQAASIIVKLQDTVPAITDATQQITAGTDDPLELLVIRALNQGQSEGYIDALVNHAAQTGQVTVPESLITRDGRVNTGALLSALSPAATAQPGPGKGTYVVEPGDTLASIAYRFYGQTSARHQIFEANKNRINASGNLQAGLELVLPAN